MRCMAFLLWRRDITETIAGITRCNARRNCAETRAAGDGFAGQARALSSSATRRIGAMHGKE